MATDDDDAALAWRGGGSSAGGRGHVLLQAGGASGGPSVGKGNKGSGTIQSPASLLYALRDEEARTSRAHDHDRPEQPRNGTSSITASSGGGGGGDKKVKVIIEDCAAVPSAASALLPPPANKAPPAPAMKKGFLNSASHKAPLYPTGSSEGAGGAAGGSLQRVMDKCKVINARDVGAAPAVPAHPHAAKAPAPPAPAPAPPVLNGVGGSGSGSGGKRPTDRELDALFGQLDDDFAKADRHLRAKVGLGLSSSPLLSPLLSLSSRPSPARQGRARLLPLAPSLPPSLSLSSMPSPRCAPR